VTSQTGYLRSLARTIAHSDRRIEVLVSNLVPVDIPDVYYSGPVSSAVAGEPFHVRLPHSRARADAMQADDRRRSDLPGLVYIQGLCGVRGDPSSPSSQLAGSGLSARALSCRVRDA
jgi:hypothetical protein